MTDKPTAMSRNQRYLMVALVFLLICVNIVFIALPQFQRTVVMPTSPELAAMAVYERQIGGDYRTLRHIDTDVTSEGIHLVYFEETTSGVPVVVHLDRGLWGRFVYVNYQELVQWPTTGILTRDE